MIVFQVIKGFEVCKAVENTTVDGGQEGGSLGPGCGRPDEPVIIADCGQLLEDDRDGGSMQ